MLLVRFGQSSNSDIAVADGLDLENTAAIGNLVERTKDGLEKREDLGGLTYRAPSSKARDVCELRSEEQRKEELVTIACALLRERILISLTMIVV